MASVSRSLVPVVIACSVAALAGCANRPRPVQPWTPRESLLTAPPSRESAVAVRKTEQYLRAGAEGRWAWVETLLMEGKRDGIITTDTRNHSGQTALHLAAFNGHNKATAKIISFGIPVDAQDDNGDTALHLAAAKGNRHCAQSLLEAGADRTIRNKDGKTAADVSAPAIRGLVR